MSKLLNINKLICLIGILGFSINSVIASEIINLAKAPERPVWQELCPQGLKTPNIKILNGFGLTEQKLLRKFIITGLKDARILKIH